MALADRMPCALSAARTGTELGGRLVGIGLHLGEGCGVASGGAAQGSRTVGIAKPDASRPGGLQGGLGALGDHLALMLGDGRHDGQREAVGLGQIAGMELDAGLLQAKQEMGIAGEPVQLGDDQRGPRELGLFDGGGELRAVIPLAALHLDILGKQRGGFPLAGHEGGDGLALGLYAKAALALLVGRYAEIADDSGRRQRWA